MGLPSLPAFQGCWASVSPASRETETGPADEDGLTGLVVRMIDMRNRDQSHPANAQRGRQLALMQ